MAAAAALLRLPLWRAAARGPGPRGAGRRLPGAAPGATGRPGSPRRGLAAAAGDGAGAGRAGAAKATAGGEPWWRGPEYREDFPGLLSELRGRLARRQAQKSGVLLELYRLARSPEEAEAAIAATEEHRRVGAARKNFRPYQPKVSASLFRACRLTGHLAAVPDLVRRQRELGLEVSKVALNKTLVALAEAGDLPGLLATFAGMKEAGMAPDRHQGHILVKGLTDAGQADAAAQVAREFQLNGVSLKPVTLALLQ